MFSISPSFCVRLVVSEFQSFDVTYSQPYNATRSLYGGRHVREAGLERVGTQGGQQVRQGQARVRPHAHTRAVSSAHVKH